MTREASFCLFSSSSLSVTAIGAAEELGDGGVEEAMERGEAAGGEEGGVQDRLEGKEDPRESGVGSEATRRSQTLSFCSPFCR
jgi:hypothetical protein